MTHGSYIALFDVLGFEERLTTLGLNVMLDRYEALIEVVNYRKEQVQRVFGTLGFSEAPYWTAEGDVFIFSETHGAYASDSLLLWANRTWPEAAEEREDAFQALADNPAEGWKYHPIPCDNFLDVCNDLMCRGLEVGLPLRGAIAIGDAVLDQSRSIFLGKPIVEAARLESGQRLIGASFCASMAAQMIPQRFAIKFDKHIKESHRPFWGGAMLDWPRHWRRTRKADLGDVISALNTNPRYASYYENTLELIAFSQNFAGQFESSEETSVRTQYKPFSWSNSELSVRARAIRRVPIKCDA
jgi:hypothetical protein